MTLKMETLAEPLIKELIKQTSNLKDEASQFVGKEIREYLKKYYEKYSQVKTFIHGYTPMNFYDIYYPLKLTKRVSHLSSIKKESLNVSFNKYAKELIDPEEFSKVFAQNNSITIIGEAGSGKSTLIKHIFLRSIDANYAIPILIELRYLNDRHGDIVEYISKKILDNKISQNVKILDRLFEQGKFIFFLDGFDEIKASYKDRVTRLLIDFVAKYPNNKYILTARPYSEAEALENFNTFYVKDLDKTDIGKFIEKQLKDNDELAEKIKKSVKDNKTSYLRSFLTNPLLLSLYILTFQKNPDIPNKKYFFYRRVIDALFSEHDSRSKVAFKREKKCNLSQEYFEEILQKFCFLTFFDGVYQFEKKYVLEKLKQIKGKHPNLNFESIYFIDDLKIAISLWIEDEGILTFAHRSLQEYFAAMFVTSLPIEQKKWFYDEKLIKEYNSRKMFALNNFFSLCKEMDILDFTKYLFLPVLKKSLVKLYKEDKIEVMYGLNFFLEAIKCKKELNYPYISIKESDFFRTFSYCLGIGEFVDIIDRIQKLLIKFEFKEFTIINFKEKNKKTMEFCELLEKDSVILNKIEKFAERIGKEIKNAENYIEKTTSQNKDLINMI